MKKIRFFAFGFLIIIALSFIPKNPKNNPSTDPELLSVDGIGVPLSEFLYVYGKNNATNEQAYTKENLGNYLDLYIKFRLKVREAQQQGIDTTHAFKTELEGYKKQLAQPYLTDRAFTDTLVNEVLARLQEEVKASHILVKCAENAEPKDTLVAYNKILELRKRILAGEQFEAIASTYSEDPSAKFNGGDLGFFTALQMVYEFESMAYKTKIGEVSMPFRTKFGYHIVKVTGRRPSQGEVLVAHIMIRYAMGTNPEDSVNAVRKIEFIYQKATTGSDWNELCSQFSDDANTKMRGGELPMFSTGQSLPMFEEASFALKNYGDISKPIQTPYGFHIIKLISRRSPNTYENTLHELKSKVAKDPRAELSRISLINKLKKDHAFKENTKVAALINNQADSTLLKAKWTYNPKNKDLDKPVFFINNKPYKLNEFLLYAQKKQRIKYYITPEAYIQQLYKDYIGEMLLAEEEANLEKKYPEYRLLLKEYREGIMLFTLMDSKVWNRAIEDTAGLRKYHEANRDKYIWKKRFVGTIYSCKDAATVSYVMSFAGARLFPAFPNHIEDAFFQSGKADLDGDLQKKIDFWATILKRDKNITLYLSAFSTKAEQSKSKIKLSEARLRQVVAKLTTAGINISRIVAEDKGAIDPTKLKLGGSYQKVTGTFITSSPTVLEKLLSEKDPLALQVKDGKFQEADEEITKDIDWKEGMQKIEKNGRIYLVHILQILPAGLKSLDECKGMVISDYQNELEKQWIEQLKAKYTVKVNQAVFQSLIKK